MHNIRILLLLSQISAILMAEQYFDHAFRKDNMRLRSESFSINKDSSSKLQKRVGIAMGEEDSESGEPMEEHMLLRRTGLLDDQDAVETVKSVRQSHIDIPTQNLTDLQFLLLFKL